MKVLKRIRARLNGVVACTLLVLSAVAFGGIGAATAYAVPEDSSASTYRAYVDTVEDTYRTYLCKNNGAHNRSKYDVNYKALRFNNGYHSTGARMVNSWGVTGQCQHNHNGIVYIYQYQYKVW